MRSIGVPMGHPASITFIDMFQRSDSGGFMNATFMVLWFFSPGLLSQPNREASVVCVDGSTQKGVIENWTSDAELKLQVRGVGATPIAIQSIDAIRISDAPVGVGKSGWIVESVDGTTLSFTQIEGDGEQIHVQNELIRKVSVRLDRVQSAAHLDEAIVWQQSATEWGRYDDRVWLEKPSGGSYLVRCCFPGWLLGESSVLGASDWVELDRGGAFTRYALEGSWFPDGFGGAMGELLCAIAERREPFNSAAHNLLSLRMTLAACASAEQDGAPVSP